MGTLGCMDHGSWDGGMNGLKNTGISNRIFVGGYDMIRTGRDKVDLLSELVFHQQCQLFFRCPIHVAYFTLIISLMYLLQTPIIYNVAPTVMFLSL